MIKSYKIDKYYIEKVSGKSIKDRPELQKMMDYVREGDIVYVESISRFGRSLQDLLNLINQLNDKGVQFKSLKEGQARRGVIENRPFAYIFVSCKKFCPNLFLKLCPIFPPIDLKTPEYSSVYHPHLTIS